MSCCSLMQTRVFWLPRTWFGPARHANWSVRGLSRCAAKYQYEIDHPGDPGVRRFNWRTNPRRRQRIAERAARTLGVETAEVWFVQEHAFALRAPRTVLLEFCDIWDYLAAFYELRGIGWGEGDAIGFAARYCGLSVRSNAADWGWLFNPWYIAGRASADLSALEARLLDEARISKEQSLDSPSRTRTAEPFHVRLAATLARYLRGAPSVH